MSSMRLSNLMLPDLEAAYRTDADSVRELFAEIHVEDVADLVEAADRELAAGLLCALSPEHAAEVLASIEEHVQAELIEVLGVERAAPIVQEMASDERADVIADLDDPVASRSSRRRVMTATPE